MNAFDLWHAINATAIVLGILIFANLLGGRGEKGRRKRTPEIEKRKP